MRIGARTPGGGDGRQWTEDEGRAALAELWSSGETMLQFARRRGISVGRLTYWKKRLGKAEPPAAFVEVSVAASSHRQIEIARDGVVVRVREDLDIEHLAHIVEVLGRPRGC